MSEITYSPTLVQNVKGRVIVLTGGAQGIGAESVKLLHSLGAHVVFGDIAKEPGTALEASLATIKESNGSATFRYADVSSYADQLALFEEAFKKHGRVDAAVTCAGVTDHPTWFPSPSSITLEDVKTEAAGIDKAIATNLISAIHFTRLALAYINASPPHPNPVGNFTPSVAYTVSLAGLVSTPGYIVYSSGKHGLVGLVRSLYLTHGPTRFNAVCPSATDTGLVPEPVKAMWVGAGFRMQPPADVARYIVQTLADEGMNGRVAIAAGGKAWETEGELEKVRSAWLGYENAHEIESSIAMLAAATEAARQ